MNIDKLKRKRAEVKAANRKYYFPRTIMTLEERRERNGDKSHLPGFSSSGVKLPSREDMELHHKEKMERSRRYQEKHDGEDKKHHGRFFITQNNFSAK